MLLDGRSGDVVGGVEAADDEVCIWVISPALHKMFLNNLSCDLMSRIVRTRDGLLPWQKRHAII